MPGALVYTNEELTIVVCNDRFAEMYPVPRELLQPGRSYPEFLRYLAEQATTATATSTRWSPSGCESLRNPSGRRSRIARRMAASTGRPTRSLRAAQ